MDEVDDLFEDAHNLEAQWIEDGRAEGVRDGKRAGVKEGWELGVGKGYEIGVEIGYYAGCVHVWQQLKALDPNAFPARTEKGIASLAALLDTYPLYDPQDERLHDLLEDVKSKFKTIASQLGVLEDYFPREAATSLNY